MDPPTASDPHLSVVCSSISLHVPKQNITDSEPTFLNVTSAVMKFSVYTNRTSSATRPATLVSCLRKDLGSDVVADGVGEGGSAGFGRRTFATISAIKNAKTMALPPNQRV